MLLAHPAPAGDPGTDVPEHAPGRSAAEQSAEATGERGGFVGSVTDRIKTGGLPARKALPALALVLFLVCSVAVVWVSALQAQVPRNMPFGVTGTSPVVSAAESAKVSGYRISFVNTTYPNEAAAMDAINQGKIYGAYITGTSSDTLLTVQAKSFFAYTEIAPLFAETAAKLGRPLHVSVVKPLPAGKDPVGAVAGTLLTATIVGGMVAAILIFTLTGLAVQRWRTASLIGITLLAALLTDVIAGPVFGAYAGDKFWPLLPCLWLVTLSTALVGAALIAVLPAVIALVVLEVLFIVVGLVTAGTAGVALLPTLLAVDRGGVAAALRRQPVPKRPLLLIEQHHHPDRGAGGLRADRGGGARLRRVDSPPQGDRALRAGRRIRYRPHGRVARGPDRGRRRRGRRAVPGRVRNRLHQRRSQPRGAQPAVRHDRHLPAAERGPEEPVAQGHHLLRRGGREDRDRPSQGLGSPDPRYRRQHTAGRPEHQRPRALHPRHGVREGGQEPRPEADARAVHADAAGLRRPVRDGARDPAHPAAAVRLPGRNDAQSGDQGHRRPAARRSR